MDNIERIESLKDKYESNFEEIIFNENISTTSQKEFLLLCNQSIVNGVDYNKLESFIINLVDKNERILSCYNEYNAEISKYKDSKIIEKFNELKNRYKTKEELFLNFDNDMYKLQVSLSGYNKIRHYCEQTIDNINNFNMFCELQHSIDLDRISFDIEFGNTNCYNDLEVLCKRVEGYILILKKLKDMIDKKQFTPHDDQYEDAKQFWRDAYERISFDSYREHLVYKFNSDLDDLEEIIKLHSQYEKVSEDVRILANDIKLRFESNRVLTDIFLEDLRPLLRELKEVNEAYFSENVDFDEIMSYLFNVKQKLYKLNEDYNHVLAPVTNTINSLEIDNKEDIIDIEDYYIYSISKLIERMYNLYGSPKNISDDELNDLIQIVQDKLYVLTRDQKNAVLKSVEMLNSPHTANCLIQGDVSSGKTIVIIILMFLVAQKKMKSVYIVPRRVLRSQHLRTLKKYNELFGLGLKIYDSKEKFDIHEADIILNGYSFNDPMFDQIEISLGVIDEIQLFGVQQRNQVQKKFPNIDMFYTTATPHPRTKLLTLIGNLDIVEIREKPPGRKECKTIPFSFFNSELEASIRLEASKGNMTFVVCPLINKEGSTPYESLYTAYDRYKEIFHDLNVVHLSTKLSDNSRDDIIEKAVEGEIDILVATKSIEVGVDIQRASVMVIHYPHGNSFKWGVSQLHQLRGRVGRANQDSFCFIEVPSKTSISGPIGSVLSTNDVFELTKNDFDWRGFEKIIGTRQSGKSSNNTNMERRIAAYEMVALNSRNRFRETDRDFIVKLDRALRKNKVENLN